MNKNEIYIFIRILIQNIQKKKKLEKNPASK